VKCAAYFSWGQAQILIRGILNVCLPAPLCPVKFTAVKGKAHFTGVGPADRTGVVKIVALLDLEPRLNKKIDLTGQAKLNIFQRSQNNTAAFITFDQLKLICF